MRTSDEVRGIFARCRERMEIGALRYGERDWERKDTLLELEEELLDVICYAAMEILKVQRLRRMRDAD